MDQRSLTMQGLRTGLNARLSTLQRISGATVTIGAMEGPRFTVTFSWELPTRGSFTKTYTPENSFAPMRPGQPRLRTSYCRFRDELCREVLAARGVSK
jgi:hypothetical protein